MTWHINPCATKALVRKYAYAKIRLGPDNYVTPCIEM